MADNSREIVNGANPSIIWSQYMDFLTTYGKQMKAEYTKRMRENNPFTWAEIDAMNKDIHDRLDILMTSNEKVDTKIHDSKNPKKNTIKLNESQLKKIVAESVKNVLKEYHPDKVMRDYQIELFRKKQIEQDEIEISKCMSELKPIFDSFEDKYGDLAYVAIMRLGTEMNPYPEN